MGTVIVKLISLNSTHLNKEIYLPDCKVGISYSSILKERMTMARTIDLQIIPTPKQKALDLKFTLRKQIEVDIIADTIQNGDLFSVYYDGVYQGKFYATPDSFKANDERNIATNKKRGFKNMQCSLVLKWREA